MRFQKRNIRDALTLELIKSRDVLLHVCDAPPVLGFALGGDSAEAGQDCQDDMNVASTTCVPVECLLETLILPFELNIREGLLDVVLPAFAAFTCTQT